ncbi:MAG: hypothetical protein KDK63_05075 [Chlamydiia bacterium]|nr:hypothetical protein [Chlamydiia bacterium]
MSFRFLTFFALFTSLSVGNLMGEEKVKNPSIPSEEQMNTFHVSLDALYWHTSEIVDWAFTLKSDETTVKTSYKTFDFDWAPGFRLGLGYNMAHDQWDTRARYTWFQAKARATAGGPVTPAFLGARLGGIEPFSSGKGSLDLLYHMFDWDLGKAFYVSQALSLRLAVGLKGGWIAQKLNTSWKKLDHPGGPVSATEDLRQHFSCGGPKGGVTGQWWFLRKDQSSFGLIGMLEAGYLLGHWSIKDKYTDTLNVTARVLTNDRNFGALVLYSFIGLGWELNFNQDRNHFALRCGYEIEDWLNQCQFFTDTSGSQSNDLSFQGTNLRLTLDF